MRLEAFRQLDNGARRGSLMVSALTLIPTFNQVNANRGCSRAGDLISVRAHQSRASTRRLKGPNAMTTQSPPTVSPESAQEVSESADAFMQLLMDPKYWGLPFKMIEKPENIIEAFIVIDADGQPHESSAYDEGPVLVVTPAERTAWALTDEPQKVRRVVMVIMPKGSEVSRNGGES